MKEKNSLNNETLLRKFAKGKNTEAKETGVQNCVIYTRVSSKEQMDTNQSLEWQKKYCDDYARKNSLVIKGYFGGTYESAKSDERKEFNRMLKFVKASKEKISYILVYSLDRFSRTGDSAIYIAGELKKVGINIMAVTQPIDTNSHAGALQQNIQFIFSKYDNDLRRQKTIDGMREKLLRGEWIGNAPTGYEFVKGAPTQTIIINKKGALIKEAFEYRAIGMTIEQIIERLKVRGLTVPKQTLAEIFKNPFYCGKMSHNLLNGELVKGKHPALISEELFLKANELKTTAGFKVNKANDNLPLKVFVKDADTGYPYTGYLVKKKGLYYYKVNKIGIGINRSVKIMHDKFQEFLKKYSVENRHFEPLKAHLHYVWDFCTEANTSEKKALSLQINSIDEEFFTLRKNHAIGKVAFDIYQEFSVIFAKQKEDLMKAYEKLDQKLSNPKELIDFASRLACNLPSAWACGDYYQKQTFQNTLFPQGVVYDVKIEHYRTEKVNSVIELTSQLSNDSEEIKKPVFSNFSEKTGLVPQTGLEPVQSCDHRILSPACLPIPPPGHFG